MAAARERWVERRASEGAFGEGRGSREMRVVIILPRGSTRKKGRFCDFVSDNDAQCTRSTKPRFAHGSRTSNGASGFIAIRGKPRPPSWQRRRTVPTRDDRRLAEASATRAPRKQQHSNPRLHLVKEIIVMVLHPERVAEARRARGRQPREPRAGVRRPRAEAAGPRVRPRGVVGLRHKAVRHQTELLNEASHSPLHPLSSVQRSHGNAGQVPRMLVNTC